MSWLLILAQRQLNVCARSNDSIPQRAACLQQVVPSMPAQGLYYQLKRCIRQACQRACSTLLTRHIEQNQGSVI
jgi:hypothetical protein